MYLNKEESTDLIRAANIAVQSGFERIARMRSLGQRTNKMPVSNALLAFAGKESQGDAVKRTSYAWIYPTSFQSVIRPIVEAFLADGGEVDDSVDDDSSPEDALLVQPEDGVRTEEGTALSPILFALWVSQHPGWWADEYSDGVSQEKLNARINYLQNKRSLEVVKISNNGYAARFINKKEQ